MRLAAAGVSAPQLSAVLLTHLHSDHFTDLGDVITTRCEPSVELTEALLNGLGYSSAHNSTHSLTHDSTDQID